MFKCPLGILPSRRCFWPPSTRIRLNHFWTESVQLSYICRLASSWTTVSKVTLGDSHRGEIKTEHMTNFSKSSNTKPRTSWRFQPSDSHQAEEPMLLMKPPSLMTCSWGRSQVCPILPDELTNPSSHLSVTTACNEMLRKDETDSIA